MATVVRLPLTCANASPKCGQSLTLRGPAFGNDFQQPYVEDWLRWAGVDDIRSIVFRPNLATADPEPGRRARPGNPGRPRVPVPRGVAPDDGVTSPHQSRDRNHGTACLAQKVFRTD